MSTPKDKIPLNLDELFEPAPQDVTRVSLPKEVPLFPEGTRPGEKIRSTEKGPSVLREIFDYIRSHGIDIPEQRAYGGFGGTKEEVAASRERVASKIGGTLDFISGELETGAGIGDLGKAAGTFGAFTKSISGPKSLTELGSLTKLKWKLSGKADDLGMIQAHSPKGSGFYISEIDDNINNLLFQHFPPNHLKGPVIFKGTMDEIVDYINKLPEIQFLPVHILEPTESIYTLSSKIKEYDYGKYHILSYDPATIKPTEAPVYIYNMDSKEYIKDFQSLEEALKFIGNNPNPLGAKNKLLNQTEKNLQYFENKFGLDKYATRQSNYEIAPDEFINNKIGEQSGSNPGGWYAIKEGNAEVYVKFNRGGNGHSASENLANNIYSKFGGGTVTIPKTYVTNVNNKLGHVSFKLDYFDSVTNVDNISKFAADEFLDGTVLDILLANWDVVSYNWTNVLYNNTLDRLARIDNGGSLLFRATGGRKNPTTIANDFEWFSKEASTYTQVIKKAGHEDLIDILPRIDQQVNDLPDDWTSIVDDMGYHLDPTTKQETIDFLNRRTKEFRDFIPELRNKYIDRLADQMNRAEGENYIPSNLPPWQKVMKFFDLIGTERNYLHSVVVPALRDQYPEFNDLHITIHKWTRSSRQIRGTIAKMLGVMDTKYTETTDYLEGGAKEIVKAIGRESATAPPLFRGRYVSEKELELLKTLKPGSTYEIIPGSFASDINTAENWASNLLVNVEEGSKALDLRGLYNMGEHEWITGGKFKIISLGKELTSRGYIFTLNLRQIGTYDIP